METMTQKQKLAKNRALKEALVWCEAKGLMLPAEMECAMTNAKWLKEMSIRAHRNMKEYLETHPE